MTLKLDLMRTDDTLNEVASYQYAYRPLNVTVITLLRVPQAVNSFIFYFSKGNGGNKSLPARKGTVDEVSRGWHGDDYYQSRTVRASAYH